MAPNLRRTSGTSAPPGYHSEAALAAALDAVVARAHDSSSTVFVTRRTIGHSVEGRPIEVVTVASDNVEHATDHTGSEEPVRRPLVMIQGGMHGVEVIGTELAIHLLERITQPSPDELVSDLLAIADVAVVPCINPDGREHSLEGVMSGAMYAPGSRRNANGVDLNRNWPSPDGVVPHWLPVSGTGNKHLPWYRGESPLSEPESQALAHLLEERPPVAMLDLHSSGRILVYPWTSKIDAPADEPAFWAMIDALRSRQRHWTYTAKQSRDWYPIIGSMDDYVYDRYGCLMLTVEIGRPGESWRVDPRRMKRSFWFANPIDVEKNVENDADGCIAALIAGATHHRS